MGYIGSGPTKFNTADGLTVTGDASFGDGVDVTNSAGATLKLTSTDTTGADTELLGQIDFVSSDTSTGSAGTQARIKGVYEDNGDSSGIAFLAGASTGSGTPTISEVMRIRHEGSVGIGTASPNSFYTLADNLVVGTGSGGNGMTIFSGSSDSGYIGFNDTASNGMQGFIQYNHDGDYMALAPNGSEKMRIASTGKIETLNRNFGFFNHGTNVSLADDASIVINASVAGGGLLAIYETASGHNALFRVGYLSTSFIVSTNDASFSTSDTDGLICVFASSHTITIKNRLGSTRGFTIAMFMAGNTFAG